jgi:hypothetical protein
METHANILCNGCPGGRRATISGCSSTSWARMRPATENSRDRRLQWLPRRTTPAPMHIYAAEPLLHLKFISCGAPVLLHLQSRCMSMVHECDASQAIVSSGSYYDTSMVGFGNHISHAISLNKILTMFLIPPRIQYLIR